MLRQLVKGSWMQRLNYRLDIFLPLHLMLLYIYMIWLGSDLFLSANRRELQLWKIWGEQLGSQQAPTRQYIKPVYAWPSGHAKVLLDKQINIYSLFDNGSEVLVMPRCVHDISIFLSTWHSIGVIMGTILRQMRFWKKSDLLDHNFGIDVGGVAAKVPVFVVEHCNLDIILGWPWKCMARAQYII